MGCDGCGVEAVLYSKGVRIEAVAVISEDRKTIQGVAVNSFGYYSDVTLTRVGMEEAAQRTGMLRAFIKE